MKLHTTNYTDTFIEAAEDCPATEGEIPPQKGDKRSVATIEFELIIRHPYRYTSDDVLFRVHAEKNNLPKNEWKAAREAFFSKGQPCFRASPLTKRYGWGLHCDTEGKIALVAKGSPEYEQYRNDKSLKVVKAMRSRR